MKKAGEHMKENVNVIGHAISKKKKGIVDWYQKGVDQFNTNQESYKKMGAFDRFKWTMSNLPARLTAGSKRNQEATKKRRADTEAADAAAEQMKADMAAEAEKKKKKAAS